MSGWLRGISNFSAYFDIIALEQIIKAKDSIHRRADFMAYIDQEAVLTLLLFPLLPLYTLHTVHQLSYYL